jgi:hypothetical protein
MSAVIAFPKTQRDENAEMRFFGPAQVVMFTGVRVERLTDSHFETKPKPRRVARSNQATAEDLDI